ncbi:hypothetical protein LJPFL01_0529 [Lelliottia jeotgali]|nr:hypothetical protein LJPFL01_0529 [Lelliottia jeotgali]
MKIKNHYIEIKKMTDMIKNMQGEIKSLLVMHPSTDIQTSIIDR